MLAAHPPLHGIPTLGTSQEGLFPARLFLLLPLHIPALLPPCVSRPPLMVLPSFDLLTVIKFLSFTPTASYSFIFLSQAVLN